MNREREKKRKGRTQGGQNHSKMPQQVIIQFENHYRFLSSLCSENIRDVDAPSNAQYTHSKSSVMFAFAFRCSGSNYPSTGCLVPRKDHNGCGAARSSWMCNSLVAALDIIGKAKKGQERPKVKSRFSIGSGTGTGTGNGNRFDFLCQALDRWSALCCRWMSRTSSTVELAAAKSR